MSVVKEGERPPVKPDVVIAIKDGDLIGLATGKVRFFLFCDSSTKLQLLVRRLGDGRDAAGNESPAGRHDAAPEGRTCCGLKARTGASR